MARVLVTGGAGFIGSHLVHALVERGDKVRVFDNFSSGNPNNLAGLEDEIELIRGDLRNASEILEAVQDIEIIFHEAAFVSLPESIEKPGECYDANVFGVIELLEAARSASVERVVLASSAAVYGANMDLPLNENATPECLSPYAASKQINETLAKLYTHTYQLPVTALRYFNVYGLRQSPLSAYAAAIPKFIERLKAGQSPIVYGDGQQSRDFVYVGDVVRANLLAAGNEKAAGKVFNVCSGLEVKLLDLLDVLYSIFPKAPKPEFKASRLGDVPRSLGDPAYSAEVLGFRAKVGLDEGLKNCVSEMHS